MLKRSARVVLGGLERVVWGGALRHRVLTTLLSKHYWSLARRQWIYGKEQPHFFDHRIGSFAFALGRETPFQYYRGYLAAELLRPEDRVLDIGCGDGFFARRFFSPRCLSVDAVDIEPSAIAHATRHNPAANVTYSLLDAIEDPFPRESYDVVVWDSGLGHVNADAAALILEKIRAALAAGGAFAGSESLGKEGHDHLQFFETPGDLCGLMNRHFAHVEVRAIQYEVGGLARREAFWRCAVDPTRLKDAQWTSCD